MAVSLEKLREILSPGLEEIAAEVLNNAFERLKWEMAMEQAIQLRSELDEPKGVL